jgi:hypothetical protein
MANAYYTAEAVICSLVHFTFLILFILHVRAEFKHPELLGGIHRPAHFVGLIGSIFLFIWSWDSQAALGFHDWKSILILKDCYTCTVYFVLMKGIINTVNVISSSQGTKSPVVQWVEKKQDWICAISTALAWIVAISVDFTVLRDDWSFNYGIFLIYLALSFASCVVLVVKALYEFYSVRKTLNKSNTIWNSFFVPETRKLRNVLIVLTLVVISQAFFGFSYFTSPGRMSISQVAPNSAIPNFNLWQLVDILGQAVTLHLGWMSVALSNGKTQAPSSKSSDLKRSNSSRGQIQSTQPQSVTVAGSV